MKISRDWLQTYFDTPLPEASVIADALTFHAFEIEGIENDVFDVKVTPNRGHDCLSHRGIAKELSTILKLPLKSDPPHQPISGFTKSRHVDVSIETPLCARYIAGYILGVKVGPSPEWLRKSLEAVGQRSINNVVDATNFVMFNIGQPLHAFDADKLRAQEGRYAFVVRTARKGEKMLALDDKEYVLNESMMVVCDGGSDTAAGIAGVKGGKPSGVDESTQNIILEAANFDGASVRKTATALKLRTDASQRFEQGISAEYAPYGIRAAADLIVGIAGGEILGFVDEYPKKVEQKNVSVSVATVNKILGASLTGAEVADVFSRLGFAYKEEGGVFEVIPPFERLDILIAEDLVEEVGRIIGYDAVPAVPLAPFLSKVEINTNFYSAERVREELMSQGYSEVITSVFADKGERAVLNKVDSVRPFLRSTLVDGLTEAQEKNNRNKELLGLTEVRLFEIGHVWRGGKEVLMLGIADETVREQPLMTVEGATYEDVPISTTERYRTFSRYPFIVRDIALWTPVGTKSDEVLSIIRAHAGDLLVRSEKFDEYKNEKTGKVSYAFRLVFQSFEKTLTDEEVNAIMGSLTNAVTERGWQVR